MKDLIYDSNNEKGLLKSIGPFRATTADMPAVGVRLLKLIKLATPVTAGMLKTYGTQIFVKQAPPTDEEPATAALSQ